MFILNVLDSLFLVACVVAISGCGREELPSIKVPTPTVTQNPADSSAPTIVVVETATPTPTPVPTVSVTYYSLTVTRQPNPNKFYTATGYCLTYAAKTYCWDDGVHIINYGSGSFGYYSYWEMAVEHLSTTQTPITSPLLVNQAFTNNILPSGGSVNAVMTTGTPTTVSCTDDGSGVLDCGSFSVDTNQVGL